MKTKNKSQRSSTPKSDAPPRPEVAPPDPQADPRANLAERMREADEYNLDLVCEMLRQVMAGTEDMRDRSEVFFLLEKAIDEGGEDRDVDRDTLRLALMRLKELPVAEQRQRLNGWPAKAFEVTPAVEKVRWIHDHQTLGSLRITLDRWQDKPTASFSEADFGGARYPLMHLEIAAGSSKRDVLEALEKIIYALREGWSAMIAQEPVTAKTNANGIKRGLAAGRG